MRPLHGTAPRLRPSVPHLGASRPRIQRGSRASRVPAGRSTPLLRDRTDVVVLASLAVAAFLIRAVPVLRGGGLFGLLGYDDGVYFAAASALVHGTLPYRDVLLVHPPGILVALAPFAALGERIGDPSAFAIARLAIMALGAVNTVLVALVAGRYGRTAGFVSAAFYAAWSTASNSERTTDLHGPQSTLVLLALLVLSRPGRIGGRRALLAGIALGLATSVQLWQGVTVIVVLWWVLVRARGDGAARVRPMIACGAGAVLAFALICLPFFLAAPDAMVHEILFDQIGRSRFALDLVDRVRVLEGFPQLTQLPPRLAGLVPTPVVVAGACVAVGAIVLTAWRRPWTRLWAVMALAQGLVVLATPSFFNDYASFVAPAASLVLGSALAASVLVLRRSGARVAVAASPAIVVILLVGVVSAARTEGTVLPLAALERDLAGSRCVSADSPSLLALTSVLHRGLQNGCALLVDPTGLALGSRRVTDQEYQRAMQTWYTSGDAALFVRPRNDALSEDVSGAIAAALPVEHRHGPVEVRLSSEPGSP